MGVFVLFSQIVGFLGFTLAVAIGTALIIRRMGTSADSSEEFFGGGKALTWPFVFGSLMLTNLSTETLVGLNGACWKDGNLVASAWETTAAMALVITAAVFLPRYYVQGFITTPALLEQTFGENVRIAVSGMFICIYVFITIPAGLYSGAVAFQTMFDLEKNSGRHIPLPFLVWVIAIIGSAYVLGGGMKSVAVSDTLNGVGLLVGGLAVPVIATARWGGELWRHPERLSVFAIKTKEHPLLEEHDVSVPWHVVFTGMLFIQMFYWSTNQVIMQRALCAASFADGQKGLLYAALFKIFGPTFLCLVGVLALGVESEDLGIPVGHNATQAAIANRVDRIYPAMVRLVLPEETLGAFAGVLLGSVLSSFNSGLSSASTLFALELFPLYHPSASSSEKVRAGQGFGIVLAIVSACVAPLFGEFGGVFNLVRKSKHVFALPVLALFIICIVSRRPSKSGAWCTIVVGAVCYASTVNLFEGSLWGIHWIHKYLVALLVAIGAHETIAILLWQPCDLQTGTSGDSTQILSWSYARRASAGLIFEVFLLYIVLTFPSTFGLKCLMGSWFAFAVFFLVERSVPLPAGKPEVHTVSENVRGNDVELEACCPKSSSPSDCKAIA